MSIEAKDVYGADNLINKKSNGYSSKDINGQIYRKKFINTLDYSLDLPKMRELYEKIYRRANFSSNINHKDYTNTAICIKFTYSYKEFNRIGKNIYIKAGRDYNELAFNDYIAIENNELLGIITNTNVSIGASSKILGNYFVYENGVYKQIGNIKTLITKAQLREYLYKNGFTCDGIKYVRFKRSSGSSRVGKCLFIDQALYESFHKWDLCGLKIKNGDEIDLAAFESYISLPSSSIIDTIILETKNFLVIDDYESVFEDNAIGVKYINNKLIAEEDKFTIKNSLFDGESLLDETMFEKDYKNRGMLLLRNRFFKSACFNTNIQLWFRENNITDISQLNGFTLATDIKDIKIITTPSSIKYVKFAPLKQWFDNLDSTFGIVKHEKSTYYFDGRMVQCHYQLLNTLQLSYDDIHKLLEPNLKYLSDVRNDPDILRYHIKYSYDQLSDEPIPLKSKNEIVYKLMGMNDKFSKTKLYYDFRNDLIKSMLRNLKQGHLLIHGTYATLLGNGVEMLQHSIGKFKGESILGFGNIHCSNFGYNKIILGSRSPHINSGNILLIKNVTSNEIDKYFNLSKEIVYINSIGENILQRLNGADFDSDSQLLTDNPILIEAAQKNYDKFLVPTSMVVSKKVKRHYTDEDKADLDIKTSINKIGEIVNLSQYLNSILWDKIFNGKTVESCNELYLDICKLAVLSGIEIDRAKKEYELSSVSVISELKEKYKIVDNNCLVKPMFFKMITLENGFDLNDKHEYKYFKTPMDFLQKQISSFNFRENRKQKEKFLNFTDIITVPNVQYGNTYYKQRDRIINLVLDAKKAINDLYDGYDKKNKNSKELVMQEASFVKQACIEYINELSVNETTMYLLLKSIENKKYKSISRLIFTTLFGTPNKTFYKLVKIVNEIPVLEENEYGSINIFDIQFIKTILKIQKND